MNVHRRLIAALAAVLIVATSSLAAAAANPTGTWKWSISTPNGDAIDISARLELKDGKLTGTYQSPFGEAPISNASLKEDAIAFEVEREFNGNKFVVKYAGKIDGDTIKGTIEFPGFGGGEPQKSDWNARRAP